MSCSACAGLNPAGCYWVAGGAVTSTRIIGLTAIAVPSPATTWSWYFVDFAGLSVNTTPPWSSVTPVPTTWRLGVSGLGGHSLTLWPAIGAPFSVTTPDSVVVSPARMLAGSAVIEASGREW